MKVTKSLRINLNLTLLVVLSWCIVIFPRAVSAAPGDVDITFNSGNITYLLGTQRVNSVVVQSDEKILIGGAFSAIGGVARHGLARLNADGSLDTTFVPPFFLAAQVPSVHKIAIQTDGKIVVAGSGLNINNTFYSIVRLNQDGSPDSTFALQTMAVSNGIEGLALQPDGKILIGGDFSNIGAVSTNTIARLNTNGTLDPGFVVAVSPAYSGRVVSIVLQPDGKILAGGDFFVTAGMITNRNIARLNSNGTLDTSLITVFNVNEVPIIRSLALRPDGKVYIGGVFTSINGVSRVSIARINSDGTLDTAFNANIPTSGDIRVVLLQPKGKILIGGNFFVPGDRRGFARLNLDGTFDSYYPTPTGFLGSFINAIAVQTDGNFLLGGEFTFDNHVSVKNIARLLDTPPRRFADFDGEGRADLSVFRPSDRVWYIRSSRDGFLATQWGLATDMLTPADYDGDGKADIAVWRPAPPTQAAFYILNSSSFTLRVELFGQTGDVPVAGDFDGDGKSDVAVYRNGAQSSFFYRASLNNPGGITTFLPWGTNADVPMAGDYDGDGKADAAVFRPSNNTWYVLQSSTLSQQTTAFGLNTDRLVPADYDGDGKTDIAVFRTGVWYVLSSGVSTISATVWGLGSDRLVPADYDGDGKTDFAIYRNGVWWILQSTNNLVSIQSFGLGSDVPVPSVYVP